MFEARLLGLVMRHPHPAALARKVHDGSLVAELRQLERRDLVTKTPRAVSTQPTWQAAALVGTSSGAARLARASTRSAGGTPVAWASVPECPLTQPRQRPMSCGSPSGLTPR